jgi:RNA polymerase sigma-70 factor, ECF subfamily
LSQTGADSTVPALPLLIDIAGEAAVDAAFEALYVAAFPKIYAFIRYQVSSQDAAQELVSRVFLKAYKHRARTPPSEPQMLQWIFRIAHTTVIDYWRVDRKRQSVNLSVEELSAVPSGSENPEQAYERKQRALDVVRIMHRLSEEDRTMLALKFAAHRTNREIAAILRLSEGAVSMRLLRALRRLREHLREIGWS